MSKNIIFILMYHSHKLLDLIYCRNILNYSRGNLCPIPTRIWKELEHEPNQDNRCSDRDSNRTPSEYKPEAS
jgi:hypothetical protein